LHKDTLLFKFILSCQQFDNCSYALFATGVNDTGEFAAGVIDTDGNLPPATLTHVANLPPVSSTPVANLPPVSLIPVVHLEVQIPRICLKHSKWCLMGLGRKPILEKTRSKKSRDTFPLR
jgi:hypothetical protein